MAAGVRNGRKSISTDISLDTVVRGAHCTGSKLLTLLCLATSLSLISQAMAIMLQPCQPS